MFSRLSGIEGMKQELVEVVLYCLPNLYLSGSSEQTTCVVPREWCLTFIRLDVSIHFCPTLKVVSSLFNYSRVRVLDLHTQKIQGKNRAPSAQIIKVMCLYHVIDEDIRHIPSRPSIRFEATLANGKFCR